MAADVATAVAVDAVMVAHVVDAVMAAHAVAIVIVLLVFLTGPMLHAQTVMTALAQSA